MGVFLFYVFFCCLSQVLLESVLVFAWRWPAHSPSTFLINIIVWLLSRGQPWFLGGGKGWEWGQLLIEEGKVRKKKKRIQILLMDHSSVFQRQKQIFAPRELSHCWTPIPVDNWLLAYLLVCSCQDAAATMAWRGYSF